MIGAKVFLLLDYTGSLMKNYVFTFSQALIVFKKPFLLFSKMKISWLKLKWSFLFFIYYFPEDLHVCSPFLLFFSWKILKKIEKDLISTCFKKPGFRFCIITTEQNKTEKFLHTFLQTLPTLRRDTCSKFQRKVIISTWQIGYKLISKNNNFNSKDNNISIN